MTNTRRIRFTLVELMVVLFLSALCIGALGVRLVSSMREGKIETAAKRLAHKIELTGQSMVALNEDLELHLMVNDKGLEYSITSRGEPLPTWRALVRGGEPLEGIHSMEWNEEPQKSLILRFSALSGGLCEQGLLTLFSKEGSERHLTLWGNPAPISISRSRPPLPTIELSPYPDALAQLPSS